MKTEIQMYGFRPKTNTGLSFPDYQDSREKLKKKNNKTILLPQ